MAIANCPAAAPALLEIAGLFADSVICDVWALCTEKERLVRVDLDMGYRD